MGLLVISFKAQFQAHLFHEAFSNPHMRCYLLLNYLTVAYLPLSPLTGCAVQYSSCWSHVATALEMRLVQSETSYRHKIYPYPQTLYKYKK